MGNKGGSGANQGRLGFTGEGGESGVNQGGLGNQPREVTTRSGVLRAGFLSTKTCKG